MEKEKLNEIKALTMANNHTYARKFIASQFKYLYHFERLFHLVIKINELEGSQNYNILKYSNELTKDMFKFIERHEGKEKADEIYACL